MVKTQNNQSTLEYATARIAEIVDIETVAECLGIDSQKRGRKVSILCPAHGDRHFGSCFLRGSNAFKCYSCGAYGDAIELTRLAKNCSFQEACEFVCGIYGDVADFMQSSNAPRRKLLDPASLKLIGLEKETSGVSVDIAAFFDEGEAQDLVENSDDKALHIVFEPLYPDEMKALRKAKGHPVPDGHYRVMKTVDSNPLLTLLEQNEPAYRALIARKASEASDRYRLMIDMAQNPNNYLNSSEPEILIMAYCCQDVIAATSVQAWRDCLQRRIRQCDNIRIEFSGESAENTQHKRSETQRKKPNLDLFGKIKGSTSL